MGYAFISYSTKNQSDADALKALFHKNGIRTWMAPGDIPAGSKYAQVINHAIKECACFVLLLTDAAQSSPWVAKEVERAVNHGKTIIPVKMEDLVLNEEFEFYISTDQIVAVQKIDENSVEFKKILTSIIAFTGTESGQEPGQEPRQADTQPAPAEPAVPVAEPESKPEPRFKPKFERWRAYCIAHSGTTVFGHYYPSELFFYGLGIVLFAYFLMMDVEFAAPLLLICIGLGIIPATIQRLIKKQPLLPSPWGATKINTLCALLYGIIVTHRWGSDMEFFDLFEDWGEYNMESCRLVATPLFLVFLALGLVFCVILRFFSKNMPRGAITWVLYISAYAALVFAYFYSIEHLLTRVHMTDLYDAQQEHFFLVLAIISTLVFLMLFFAIKRVISAKASTSTKI